MVRAAVTYTSLHETHWRWLHTCAARNLLQPRSNMLSELAATPRQRWCITSGLTPCLVRLDIVLLGLAQLRQRFY